MPGRDALREVLLLRLQREVRRVQDDVEGPQTEIPLVRGDGGRRHPAGRDRGSDCVLRTPVAPHLVARAVRPGFEVSPMKRFLVIATLAAVAGCSSTEKDTDKKEDPAWREAEAAY